MPDESAIIDTIVSIAGKGRGRFHAPRDDVSVVPSRPGSLLVKVDMLVEGTDVPEGMTYRQAARKAVAMCVSDFAAKGARPSSFLVSLGLRRGVSGARVRELALGIRDAEREWGVDLVGGDTNEAKELVVDCAMYGFAKKLVGRKGARAGDRLVVTGRFGLEPAGLRILVDHAVAGPKFGQRAKRSVLLPTPNLEVGLALARHLSAAMDSSDGLARSLHTLARESGVGFAVDILPVASGLAKFAERNGLDVQDLVFGGGEEYVVVGTVPKEKVSAAARAASLAGGELLVIGEATSDRGRVELRQSGRRMPIPDAGWTHLS